MARIIPIQLIASLIGVLVMLGACTSEITFAPGSPPEDRTFDRFMDGKFDSAGHPYGARVWQAETDCNPATGEPQAEGWAAMPGVHESGILCRFSQELGHGSHTLNVRLLSHEVQERAEAEQPAEPEKVLLLQVFGADDELLMSRELSKDDLRQPMIFQNFWGEFSPNNGSTVRIELSWTGKHPVRIDYLELFPSFSRLIIDPPSQILFDEQTLRMELLNLPDEGEWELQLLCDQNDRTPRLQELLAQGQATETTTEFRTIYSAPMAPILEGCQWPVHLKAKINELDQTTPAETIETGRVTYWDRPIPCAFEGGEGRTKVLLTGFESFPPNKPMMNNSSAQAVLGFSAVALQDISVMRVVLPVEYDSAPDLVTELMDRCQPDIVIMFGETWSGITIEQEAVNKKGATQISGGAPDNRGFIYNDTPIVEGGPEFLKTSLPAQRIAAALEQAGIEAYSRNRIGLYICNNVFYAAMHAVPTTSVQAAGFIHMPSTTSEHALSLQEKQTLVETAIRETLAELNSAAH